MQRKKKSKGSIEDLHSNPSQNQSNSNNPSDQNINSEKDELDKTKEPSQPGVVLLSNESMSTKWKNWWVRFTWTCVMVCGIITVLLSGHVWVILVVIAVQAQIFKEVISIADIPSKDKKLPFFRPLNWYFLISTNYFLYGESIIHYFKQSVLVDAFLMPLATHHRFISLILYIIGFILFVMNLKKGHYKFQFTQFAWTHMTLLMVVCQSHFIINNIFEGLFWFVLPISLVVVNDVMAYVFGFFFGRTPLIQLSPKKTWEGFIGAFLSTLIWGFFFSKFLSSFPYMICPMNSFNPVSNKNSVCQPNAVFIPVQYYLLPSTQALISHLTFGKEVKFLFISSVQFHALIMATFASLIAPFGGFFASGMKRAFKIKDFGDSIPGHGGMTDRMDCQLMMGLFSNMYYQSFIASSDMTVGAVLHQAISLLSPQQQIELLNSLAEYLFKQELIPFMEPVKEIVR